jgi:hypothetical protein
MLGSPMMMIDPAALSRVDASWSQRVGTYFGAKAVTSSSLKELRPMFDALKTIIARPHKFFEPKE